MLGYADWVTGLRRGIAAHHAGLLPTFKEVVEELFAAGLIRAVFATETLALGINMPARTVVIEKLDKWNGEHHADLTAGEYTQLTGRAGRRGIDVEGHAVVLWQPDMDPIAVAGLAGTRTYPLNSSFRPTYNMAVNLVGQVGRVARRAAAGVVVRPVPGRPRRGRAGQAGGRAAGQDGRAVGDLRAAATSMTTTSSGVSSGSWSAASRGSGRRPGRPRRSSRWRNCGPATSSTCPAAARPGVAVVLQRGGAGDGRPLPLVLTANQQVKRLSVADFPVPVGPIERIRIPPSFSPKNPAARRDLVSTVRNKLAGRDPDPRPRDRRPRAGPAAGARRPTAAIESLRRRLRKHSCHGCPDLQLHLRDLSRRARLEREAAALEERVSGRSHVLARTFGRVCSVLEELGYMAGDEVTPQGRKLAALYAELDLLAAECLRRGSWDGLAPADLAACVSALTFETRRAEDAAPARLPHGRAA